jgi:hypothetical protein
LYGQEKPKLGSISVEKEKKSLTKPAGRPRQTQDEENVRVKKKLNFIRVAYRQSDLSI